MADRAHLLATLGLPPSATLAQAKEAYRVYARAFHPDRPGGNSEALARINAAWDALQASFASGPRATTRSTPKDPASKQAPSPDLFVFEDTPALDRALSNVAGEVMRAFIDARIATLRANPARKRWVGDTSGVPKHPPMRVHRARSVLENGTGVLTYLCNSGLAHGSNTVIFPTAQRQGDLLAIKSPMLSSTFEHSDGPTSTISVMNPFGKRLDFRFLNTHHALVEMDVHDPAFIAGALQTHTHFINMRTKAMLAIEAGTMPRWMRPALHAWNRHTQG